MRFGPRDVKSPFIVRIILTRRGWMPNRCPEADGYQSSDRAATWPKSVVDKRHGSCTAALPCLHCLAPGCTPPMVSLSRPDDAPSIGLSVPAYVLVSFRVSRCRHAALRARPLLGMRQARPVWTSMAQHTPRKANHDGCSLLRLDIVAQGG